MLLTYVQLQYHTITISTLVLSISISGICSNSDEGGRAELVAKIKKLKRKMCTYTFLYFI
jgi:hypothetical protein